MDKHGKATRSSYDEPETLRCSNPHICPIGADVRHPLDLEALRIDIRLSYGTFPNEAAQIVSEISDDVVAVCTKAYLDEHISADDLGFFSTVCLISTDWGGVSASFPSWSDFLGEDIKRPTHIVASSHAALSIAQAGLGVALVQKLYAAEPLRRGKLVLASPQHLPMTQNYCVSVRRAVSTRPLVVQFTNWLATCLQAEIRLQLSSKRATSIQTNAVCPCICCAVVPPQKLVIHPIRVLPVIQMLRNERVVLDRRYIAQLNGCFGDIDTSAARVRLALRNDAASAKLENPKSGLSRV